MSPPGSGEAPDFDDEFDARTGKLIRPYAMTRGRTAIDVEPISLEAQLQRTAAGTARLAGYRWEAATILKLANRQVALIEVAALARIPIGVVRVLAADLIADGALEVQHFAPPDSTATYRNLLERVLDGVRSL